MARHVIVDGSNIATEGRTSPSLRQLNEAVLAFIEEFPSDTISVVVDATFGHRIDKSEVAEFNEAVENNEIVCPPAGAIGRGDAFVLLSANKVKGSILSNDSYQEFHGQYEWLFDEGRLIGGKPVPNIGWVFVNRVPVRGPVSRKAVKESKRPATGGRARGGAKASAAANQPMPVPSAPPPGAKPPVARKATKRGAASKPAKAAAAPAPIAAASTAGSGTGASQQANDLVSFLGFVEHHPVGTSLSATVESYSSHGAYVRIGDVSGYVPMRLMADPPPRSARDVMSLGETVTLVVAGFNPSRRGIDLAVPAMAPSGKKSSNRAGAAPSPKSPAKKSPAKKSPAKKETAKKVATKAPAKKSPAKKAAPKQAAPKKVAAKAPAKKVAAKAPAKKVPAKQVAKKVPAKAVAKKTPAKKSPAKKAPTRATSRSTR